jgi:hypothetical protein
MKECSNRLFFVFFTLWIVICQLMRIRIQLIKLMRIRIQLNTMMRIRIHNTGLAPKFKILYLISLAELGLCKYWTSNCNKKSHIRTKWDYYSESWIHCFGSDPSVFHRFRILPFLANHWDIAKTPRWIQRFEVRIQVSGQNFLKHELSILRVETGVQTWQQFCTEVVYCAFLILI